MNYKFVSKLGYFLYEAGRFDEAQQILEKVTISPKLLPTTSLLILANLYGNLKSIEFLEIAIEKMSQKLSEKKGIKL